VTKGKPSAKGPRCKDVAIKNQGRFRGASVDFGRILVYFYYFKEITDLLREGGVELVTPSQIRTYA